MQETEFIDQNKEKWSEFENVLKAPHKDPDRLTNLFIESTDDLSFSRTYYPNRSVRVYLNGIAQQVFQSIYRTRTKEKGRLWRFWREELPDAMWFARKQLLFAFLLFIGGFLIGIWSSIHYPEFARIVLGDGYVEMTKANIEHGDPMAVYKGDNPATMFLRIALNNVQVDFLTFVLGVLLGIGTVYVILFNSIMIGTFLYFFIERGLFWDAFYSVMLHGTLEISMIVLSGAAGLMLGRGLVFPGTHSRIQAFMLSARHAMKMMIAIALFSVIAAFIEGFVTRYTDAPDLLRGSLIAASLSLVIGYFVIYPWYRFRKGHVAADMHEDLQPERTYHIRYDEIKSNASVFNEVFYFFPRYARKIVTVAVLLALAFVTVTYFISDGRLDQFDEGWRHYVHWIFRMIWVWGEVGSYFDYYDFGLLFPVQAFLFAIIITYCSVLFHSERKTGNISIQMVAKNLFVNFLVALMILMMMFLYYGLLVFLVAAIVWPLFMMVSAVAWNEKLFFFAALKRTTQLLRRNFWKNIGLYFTVLAIQWLVLSLVCAPLVYYFGEAIASNMDHTSGFSSQVFYAFRMLLSMTVIGTLISLSVFSSHLLYYSSLETRDAKNLMERIRQIGFRKRAYGLEKEV